MTVAGVLAAVIVLVFVTCCSGPVEAAARSRVGKVRDIVLGTNIR